MQLLSLFSIVAIDDIPDVLSEYYQTLGVATLEFLPNIFLYVLPDSSNPKYDPENELPDNSKYHPNIFYIVFSPSLQYLFNEHQNFP